MEAKVIRKIAIVLIILMMVGIGFLSGCTENNTVETQKNKFLGQWYEISGDANNEVWYFYNNNTVKMIHGENIYWENYRIENSINLKGHYSYDTLLNLSYNGLFPAIYGYKITDKSLCLTQLIDMYNNGTFISNLNLADLCFKR